MNTLPDARMDAAGTGRVTFSTTDPFLNGAVGFQVAEPLYIQLRQTGLISGVNDTPDKLMPGLDFKLKLWEEGRYIPAAALSLQSALGHRQSAGEYFSLSKRYNKFDFTGGLAWGRFGSAGHIDNPLKAVSSHFGKPRSIMGESPNGPENWFTGDSVGFVAGLSYHPENMEHFSFTGEWGADRYSAETSLIDGFDAPAPWAAGVNFDGIPNTQIGLGLMGGDRVMARVTTGGDIGGWFGRGRESKSYTSQPAFFKPHRTSGGGPEKMALNAEIEKIFLMDIQTNDAAAKADVYLRPGDNTPNLVGRSVRHMANGAGQEIERFILIPRKYGLRGPTLRLSRRDFEGALVHDRGSSDEIWANAEFDAVEEDEFIKTASLTSARFQWMDWKNTRLILDNDIGLSEDDEAMLYRTALLTENRHQVHKHIVYGGALRLNIADNFRELREFRLLPARPVRSDIDLFTLRTLSVEDSFVSTMATPLPGFHIMGTGGYLEEQYAGIGGEVLYRPFGKRYAVGGELYKVYKRSPYTDFNLGLSGDDALTGTLDAYYELPETGITLHAGAGRYLAGDWGAELGLKRHFNNGAHLSGLVRLSDQEETDVFGERTHAYGGMALTLPFGQSRHVPDGSEIRLDFKPQGRDTAQRLNKPMDLYEMSEPFSMRHISENWAEVLK